ncbi:ATP-binding protein [Sphingosinithalassobacter portus]|uniref:sensor histidine kinase NtrY-like n=1 Tax=Stakelama portus TaxID=2676234 RepID=UPI000D6EA2EC
MEPVVDPGVTSPRRKRFGVTAAVELGVLILALVMGVVTYMVITRADAAGQVVGPAISALLLLGNLVPLVALIVLIGRRIAKHRAAKSSVAGGGRLHVRLVALFSVIASVPIILTVIAASTMFHSNTQFWLTGRAANAIDDAISLAKEGQNLIAQRWGGEARQITLDIAKYYPRVPTDSAEFQSFFDQQTYFRNLEQSVLFTYEPGKKLRVLYLFNPPEEAAFLQRVDPSLLDTLTVDSTPDVYLTADTIWVVAKVPKVPNLYLYAGTSVNAEFLNKQLVSAESITREYEAIQARARGVQMQFNAALFVVALLIVGFTMLIALAVADRLVRPIDRLVDAAGSVAEGDLSARVPVSAARDEIDTLGVAFNSMTERLQEQTSALVDANLQLESRRALIEAVMSGVTAGVVSIGPDRRIQLINDSARILLHIGETEPVGHALADVAPELDTLLDSGDREAIVQMTTGGEARTLAVKVTRDESGQVLTFDDITQQLLDQRRAAWSDVARRIAHEIKNPLTPIQLAAERLQRRYGRKLEEDEGTFARLTDTIVRQVGDLRRMVDEFSSFARMPKPVFREESLLDIARQAMFLHEVAHPGIRFHVEAEEDLPAFVCDRRQIGQALTNVVKNAVEAVEAREENAEPGEIRMTVAAGEGHSLLVEVADNGIGLPVERDRIVEPYMTTRSRGTGLGLAIVKKIIEEHFGTIAFADRPQGGTVVRMVFDTTLLSHLATEASEEDGKGNEPRPVALTRNESGRS